MIVHGAYASPFVRKVRVALEEKGIPHEQKDMVPFPKTEELLAKHPLGKIPVLEHEGRFVPDSSVICLYVDKLHPKASLYPEDPAEYARALFIEEFADTKTADTMGPIFFERFVKPNVFQQETDEAPVQAAIAELPTSFDWFESQLEEGAESLLSRFSIADVSVASILAGLYLLDMPIDAGRWPKLAAYMERTLARPSFQAVMGG